MTATVRVRIGSVVRQGPVVEVAESVAPGELVAAVRGEVIEGVAVDCPSPAPVHDHVGLIEPGMGLRSKTALARAGRTRGLSTPYDDELEGLRAERDALADDLADGTTPETAADRRAAADGSATVTALEEAVAAARGRLESCRERGLDTDAAADRLEAAIAELAEERTAVVATRERLRAARAERDERRDRRERLLALEDRVANCERDARAHLVDQLRGEYRQTLQRVPELDCPEDPFEAEAVDAAIAIASVASLAAPVVLACDRFEDPARARAVLDGPVVDV